MPSILDTDNIISYIFNLTETELSHTYSKVRNADNLKILQDIDRNYLIIKKKLNGKKLVLLNQVHGHRVIDADLQKNPDIQEDADGIVTAQQDTIIGVFTADCVPVLLYSANNKVIGAAHCGWKSAKLNIIQNIVEMMQIKGADEIHAIICPAIAQESYEVGPEFYESFIADDQINQQFFIPSSKAKHHMFNLTGFVKFKLNESGISKIEQIEDDTYGNPHKYPSFRRSTHNGDKYSQNFLSAIMLKS